jgi:hypothetical protein
MKSWIFAFVGLSCLLGSLTLKANGQGQTQQQVQPPIAAQQGSVRENKFKLEWITTSIKPANSPAAQAPPETEAITLVTMDGDTAMTANKVVSTDTYRRVTLRPESQKDGTTLVDVSVSEFSKDSDRDVPRLSTRLRLKAGDTRMIQTRNSKGQGYEFEYLLSITMD